MSSVSLRDLGVLAYHQTMTQWGYRTSHTRRELEGSTYWADATSMLNIGDWIFVHHVGHGNAIYAVAPLGQVRCVAEWPPREVETPIRWASEEAAP